MADRIVFNICIPLTDETTGLVHRPETLDEWLLDTVDRFGGASVVGVSILGLWQDEDRDPDENPVEDHSNWYKVGVKPDQIDALYRHIEAAAGEFGQKCIYLERAGEADFVWDPRRRRQSGPGTGPKGG